MLVQHSQKREELKESLEQLFAPLRIFRKISIVVRVSGYAKQNETDLLAQWWVDTVATGGKNSIYFVSSDLRRNVRARKWSTLLLLVNPRQ
jgi:hypothetical protein